MLLSELKENIYNVEESCISKMEIKTYLPIFIKQLRIDEICGLTESGNSGVIYFENGLALVDNLNKKIACMLTILQNYCGVEIDDGMTPKEMVEILDELIESGFYKKILDVIGSDVNLFLGELEEEIDKIKYKNNSIESILNNSLNKFVEVIDRNSNPKELQKLAKTVTKELQKLDFSKLTEINKIRSTINKK